MDSTGHEMRRLDPCRRAWSRTKPGARPPAVGRRRPRSTAVGGRRSTGPGAARTPKRAGESFSWRSGGAPGGGKATRNPRTGRSAAACWAGCAQPEPTSLIAWVEACHRHLDRPRVGRLAGRVDDLGDVVVSDAEMPRRYLRALAVPSAHLAVHFRTQQPARRLLLPTARPGRSAQDAANLSRRPHQVAGGSSESDEELLQLSPGQRSASDAGRPGRGCRRTSPTGPQAHPTSSLDTT